MKLKCKYTGYMCEVKKIRASGTVELVDGTKVPKAELEKNWLIEK